MDFNRLISQFDRLVNEERFDEAGNLLEQAKGQVDSINYNLLIALNNELIGFYRKQNKQIECLQTINDTLTLLLEIKNKNTEFYGTVYINIATGYSAFNFVEESKQNFIVAKDILTSVLDKYDNRLGALYNNFASVYMMEKDLVRARKYYKKAIEIAEKNNRILDKAQSLINMTYTFDSICDEETIDNILDEALAILTDSSVVKDKEYSFILKKYAKDFGHYGYFLVEEDLLNRANEIDERYRVS